MNSNGLQAFRQEGYVRLPGAFSTKEANGMEARIWSELRHLYGFQKKDPGTWKTNIALKLQHLKSDPLFQPIGSRTTLEAIDEVLGPKDWIKPDNWGQFLTSFPVTDRPWTVPTDIWHTDYEFDQPMNQIAGLLVFSFLSDVAPGAGGTMVISGSHRLTRRFLESNTEVNRAKMKEVRKAFMISDPWLESLSRFDNPEDRIEKFMRSESNVFGTIVKVVELSGKAGDVVLGHPWLFHASSKNCGNHPRMMLIQRLKMARLVLDPTWIED